jgi:PhzF family phenazine biosynthesis protein
MANLDYFVVDVFTETPLAGNPLAVVLNTCGLSTEQMQAIARACAYSQPRKSCPLQAILPWARPASSR